MRFLPLFALPVLAWMMLSTPGETSQDFSPEKVNLALRRTADELLRQSGDSTSRIPAVQRVGSDIWQLRLEQPFNYEQLPALLQASLDLHDIRRPYQVAVRRCADDAIDLGYHQLDFLENGSVPCGGRAMPEGCHFIEIMFAKNGGKMPFWVSKTGWLLLLALAGLAGFRFFRKRKLTAAPLGAAGEKDWLSFGNSRLDVAGQMLVCGGVEHALTFRETKLLRLFAANPDQVLERDFILQQVWADEGVLVGRSVDVFVSRLRKKLALDSSVGIVAVHGIGYRLETGKMNTA